MKRQKNDKWLDELIQRTIDTTKPEFDPEKWKQQYPEEFQSLVRRAKQSASSHQPNIRRIIFRNPIAKLAAAVVIAAISFFIAHQGPCEKVDSTMVAEVAKSPIEMMTAISLTTAYRKGGIEAVEKQCQQVFKPLGQ